MEAFQRSKARKTKQQIDAEWKAQVSRKLEELNELQGLRKDIWRIAVALEKLAGIESQDSEVQERKEKRKQR